MVLLAVKCLSGSVSEVFNPLLYTMSHVRCDPLGLLKQITPVLSSDFRNLFTNTSRLNSRQGCYVPPWQSFPSRSRLRTFAFLGLFGLVSEFDSFIIVGEACV
jgi:hypothetical protein